MVALSVPPPGSMVAVIGGGLAGLSAATRLASLGIVPTVFDMGSRAPGGRACSREPPGTGLRFDHGCQFLAPVHDEFRGAVQSWAAAGAVAEWRGRLGEMAAGTTAFKHREGAGALDGRADRSFCGIMSSPGPLFAGVPSMGAVAVLLRQEVESRGGTVVQGQRVTGLQRSATGGGWRLYGTPRQGGTPGPTAATSAAAAPSLLGTFEAVVLADALTAVTASPGYAGLAEAGLGSVVQRMAAAPPQPAFSLMVSFKEPLGGAVPFDGASVRADRESTAYAWVARNSSKPAQPVAPDAPQLPECWVAVATPEYTAELLKRFPLLRNGVYNPQTAAGYQEGVAAELLREFAALLRPFLVAAGRAGLPAVHSLHAQRWGRAFVGEPLPAACVLEPEQRVAACGDFCAGGSPGGMAAGAERAWMSGRRAAEAVAAWLQPGTVPRGEVPVADQL